MHKCKCNYVNEHLFWNHEQQGSHLYLGHSACLRTLSPEEGDAGCCKENHGRQSVRCWFETEGRQPFPSLPFLPRMHFCSTLSLEGIPSAGRPVGRSASAPLWVSEEDIPLNPCPPSWELVQKTSLASQHALLLTQPHPQQVDAPIPQPHVGKVWLKQRVEEIRPNVKRSI